MGMKLLSLIIYLSFRRGWTREREASIFGVSSSHRYEIPCESVAPKSHFLFKKRIAKWDFVALSLPSLSQKTQPLSAGFFRSSRELVHRCHSCWTFPETPMTRRSWPPCRRNASPANPKNELTTRTLPDLAQGISTPLLPRTTLNASCLLQ
jgi:hypothetical protein